MRTQANPQELAAQAARLQQRGAPLTDRLLAFGFDLCLWSPVALLIGKPFWRDFQYHQSLNPGSNEALLNFGFGLFLGLVLLLAVQTLTIWRWGATPGKKIFLLEVVHVNGGRLSLGQSFTRALTQIFELLCLAIPFLEVVSHPERRPWHDRLSESRVVTRKNKNFEAPHRLETRFFRNLYWGFGLSLFVFAFAGLTQLRHQVNLGALKRGELEKNSYLCETKTKIPAHDGMTAAQARLDFALAQFEAGAMDRDCLEAEADFAIWSRATELEAWAHLIRAVIHDDEGRETVEGEPARHFQKACAQTAEGTESGTQPRGLASVTPTDEDLRCELARYYQGDRQQEFKTESWTAKVLRLKQALGQGDFASIGTQAMTNRWPVELAGYVQDLSLKSLALQGDESAFAEGLKLLSPAWTEERRFATLGWACFAGLTRSCRDGGESPAACRSLRTELENSPSSWTSELALTFQLETRCHHRQDPVAETQVKALLSADEDLRWAMNPARAELRNLAELPQDHWSRPYLLWWLGRQPANAGHETLALEFQRGDRSEPGWWLAYQGVNEAATPAQRELNTKALSALDGRTPQFRPAPDLRREPSSDVKTPETGRPAKGARE